MLSSFPCENVKISLCGFLKKYRSVFIPLGFKKQTHVYSNVYLSVKSYFDETKLWKNFDVHIKVCMIWCYGIIQTSIKICRDSEGINRYRKMSAFVHVCTYLPTYIYVRIRLPFTSGFQPIHTYYVYSSPTQVFTCILHRDT